MTHSIEPWGTLVAIVIAMKSILMEVQYLMLIEQSSVLELSSFILESLTAGLALVAIVFTYKEYKFQQEKKKSEILSQFNDRYSTDGNIAEVVKCLMSPEENVARQLETLEFFKKEMFMRFFEELHYAIEKEALPKDVVYDYFGYYAIKAYEYQEVFYDEIRDLCWLRFRLFAESMRKIYAVRNKKSYQPLNFSCKDKS